MNPARPSRSCGIRYGEPTSVSATRVTSACVRTPYSTHHRSRASLNRTPSMALSGEMLSWGVPASDAPVSGFVPERTVPLVKAALPKNVRTPGLVTTGSVEVALDALDADVAEVDRLRDRA